MRVLVVDDDPAVRGALNRALRLEGYDVSMAADGPQALEEIAVRPPDTVVLDIGLPTIDGLDVCRRMRAAGDDTPVLMLTARDAVNDRVQGLDAGADDYLVKPFALAELLARLRALLRRRADDNNEILQFDDLTLNPITREVILDRVWGYTFDSGTNSLAVYVGYLRRKTEAGGEPRLIHTARGVGYMLRES